MMTDNSSTTDISSTTEQQAPLTREPATLLIVGVLLFGWLWLGFGWHAITETLNLPFVCADVAAVALLCAMPAAMALASLFRRRGTMWISAVASISILAVAVLMTVDSQSRVRFVSDRTLVANGYWLRPAFAIVLSLAAVCVGRWAVSFAGWKSAPPKTRTNALVLLLTLASLVLVPSAYTDYRSQYFGAQLSTLLGQSRLGEALRLARRLDALAPHTEIDGRPIRDFTGILAEQVRQLRATLGRPPGETAELGRRIEFARKLAILGEVDRAVMALEPLVSGGDPDPMACGLLGTILEGREEWPKSRMWYQRSYDGWLSRGESPERRGGLATALRGIAYTERKAGRYPEAEAAYRRLLSLVPTADTEFLLAQFYEDAQQSVKSYKHVRRAMYLAPTRYREEGQQLIDRLATSHFGCLQIFGDESQRSR